MKLSEAYDKYKREPDTYACCPMCSTAWLDDIEHMAAMVCPKCDSNGGALFRGAADPSQYGCTLDDGEPLKRSVTQETRVHNLSEIKGKK